MLVAFLDSVSAETLRVAMLRYNRSAYKQML
jgi:hypothetical protein